MGHQEQIRIWLEFSDFELTFFLNIWTGWTEKSVTLNMVGQVINEKFF